MPKTAGGKYLPRNVIKGGVCLSSLNTIKGKNLVSKVAIPHKIIVINCCLKVMIKLWPF